MNLVFCNIPQLCEEKIVRELEVAFRIRGRQTAFVGPEKVTIAKGNAASLSLLDGSGEKLLRDASAGKRDAVRFARTIGRCDCVQPRAGGGTGLFVGVCECQKFKMLHDSRRG